MKAEPANKGAGVVTALGRPLLPFLSGTSSRLSQMHSVLSPVPITHFSQDPTLKMRSNPQLGRVSVSRSYRHLTAVNDASQIHLPLC